MTTAEELVPVLDKALRNVGVNLHGTEAQQVAKVIADFVDAKVGEAAESVQASAEAAQAPTEAPAEEAVPADAPRDPEA